MHFFLLQYLHGFYIYLQYLDRFCVYLRGSNQYLYGISHLSSHGFYIWISHKYYIYIYIYIYIYMHKFRIYLYFVYLIINSVFIYMNFLILYGFRAYPYGFYS